MAFSGSQITQFGPSLSSSAKKQSFSAKASEVVTFVIAWAKNVNNLIGGF